MPASINSAILRSISANQSSLTVPMVPSMLFADMLLDGAWRDAPMTVRAFNATARGDLEAVVVREIALFVIPVARFTIEHFGKIAGLEHIVDGFPEPHERRRLVAGVSGEGLFVAHLQHSGHGWLPLSM